MTTQIKLFDTTLRDGEQSPGAAMTLQEKVHIARLLDAFGVDVIEAGFPAATHADFDAVYAVAQAVKAATVCGFARTLEKDILAAAEAIKPAQKRRINLVIAISPLHMEFKLRKRPEEVLELLDKSVRLARQFCDDVELIAEDASRAEADFLCRAVETAIKAGATTFGIPDTVGYATPHTYAQLFKTVLERVPGADAITLAAHCHNDLGLAVANTLAAVEAGARQIEGTINGIGERAGNTALEEVIMALNTRADALPYTTNAKPEMITRLSRTVSTITGMPVQPNKAVVGANAFTHASGMHQDGVLKHRETYEIMSPKSIGLTKSTLQLGKLSGSSALKNKLKELGYQVEESQFETLFQQFKDLASKKKTVYDDDIVALAENLLNQNSEHLKLIDLTINWSSTGAQKNAAVTLEIDDQQRTTSASGDGPVNAAYNAIKKLSKLKDVVLKEYRVDAIGAGSDAQVTVTVKVAVQGKICIGRGNNTNILVASVNAYLTALNRGISHHINTLKKAS